MENLKSNYSEIKSLVNQLNDLGIEETREFIDNLDIDFEVENFRFIDSEYIDQIQKDELSSDLYILGCFNASFLADVSNIPYEAIEALQQTDNYEVLGELVLPFIDEIQEEYARLDGYGHHFAHYDHNEHEINFDGKFYYAFRIN